MQFVHGSLCASLFRVEMDSAPFLCSYAGPIEPPLLNTTGITKVSRFYLNSNAIRHNLGGAITGSFYSPFRIKLWNDRLKQIRNAAKTTLSCCAYTCFNFSQICETLESPGRLDIPINISASKCVYLTQVANLFYCIFERIFSAAMIRYKFLAHTTPRMTMVIFPWILT